jgi:hypothetical protein
MGHVLESLQKKEVTEMDLRGKLAIVTGAMQGIGAGISRVLAKNGATVVLTDISPGVNQTAESLQEFGVRAYSYVMDVTDEEQVSNVIKKIQGDHGSIDILVNNAGIYPRRKLIDMDEDFLKKMFDINIFGMFRCSKSVLPSMMERCKGKIINMSSVTGPLVGAPSGGQTAYASTKAAVIGFTKALALEVAQYHINVNCVLPGYIYSPSVFELRGSKSQEDSIEKMREFGYKVPFGYQGSSEDVGNLVSFLASDLSDYLTGSEIVIDGGNILQEEYLGPYKPKKQDLS